ncbi:MAG TPA: ABC transporter ATP-binding protein [Polyangiaceae bacterium]|jgi:iron complex transport system ATP-binding protein|nr:ABC transporter ATP-binding protein [Polyangiaceae bacterium]
MAELDFVDLSVKVGGRTLLDSITLQVERGDFVALIGANGAGKTTLLKLALALRAPSSGRVELRGRPILELEPRTRAAEIAWLPQHVRADEPLSALDTVAAARFRFHETHAKSQSVARQALDRVGASDYAARRVTELSGGERQRVAFACLIAQEANTLLFDEPANHLDPAQQVEVYRSLSELWHEGRTILCVNHDVNLLAHLGESERVRVVGLSRGRIAFEARFADESLPAQMSALFGIELTALQHATARYIVASPRSST